MRIIILAYLIISCINSYVVCGYPWLGLIPGSYPIGVHSLMQLISKLNFFAKIILALYVTEWLLDISAILGVDNKLVWGVVENRQ